MAISERAQRNHDELFPGSVSTLAETDPELVAVLGDLALDEVLRQGELDTRLRLMTQLASLIASRSPTGFRVLLEAALTAGVTPVEVKEVVYQAVPYVGAAAVLDFLHATNEVLTERGVVLPLPGQSTTTPETRFERGLAVQREVVGDRLDAMYADAPEDSAHLQRLLSANCFGDFVARSGLELATRELLTFSMLVSLGGADAQVRGHVAANLRVGNDRGVLLAVLTRLLPIIGYPRTLNGLAAIDEIAPAS